MKCQIKGSKSNSRCYECEVPPYQIENPNTNSVLFKYHDTNSNANVDYSVPINVFNNKKTANVPKDENAINILKNNAEDTNAIYNIINIHHEPYSAYKEKVINDIETINGINGEPYRSTFRQRLRSLPIKVLLQLLKTKNRLKSGLGKAVEGKVRVFEGLKESSGALIGLPKHGYDDIRELIFDQ